MDFSRIRRARRAAKITQSELSDAVGLNRATISKYESGIIEPTIVQLEVISSVIGLPLEFFLSSQPFVDLELLENEKPYIISMLEINKLVDLRGKSVVDIDTLAYWKLVADNIGLIYQKEDKGLFIRYTFKASSKMRNAREPKTHQCISESITEKGDQARANIAMDQMDEDGKRKVADYAEDILPRHRRQGSPEPPVAPSCNEDPTLPLEGTEGPPGGE